MECYVCGEKGHKARDCPNRLCFLPESELGENSNNERPVKCYICGGFGHISRDCPSESGNRRETTCYNCGKPGHISRDCPEEQYWNGEGDNA